MDNGYYDPKYDNVDNGNYGYMNSPYDQYQNNGNYYGQPPYQPVEKTNPLAIVSMILGIVSAVITVFCCCFSYGANLPFAIAAIITGVLQMKSKTNQKGQGMALAGVITGGASIVLTLIAAVVLVVIYIIAIISDSSTSYDYYSYLQ